MTDTELTDTNEDEHLVATIGSRSVGCDELLERLIVRRAWAAVDDCLDSFLLEEAFDEHDIQSSDEEISTQVTDFRKKNNLASGDETRKWLEQHHMQDAEFLQMCSFEIRLRKLKDLLFADRLQEYFIYKRLELVVVELYKLVVAGEQAAREIVSSVAEGESFFEYARQYSLDVATAKSGGYLGKMKLNQLPPRVQELLGKSVKGDLLGPLKANKNFEIYLVENIEAPEFNQELRLQLEEELFTTWLADRKAQAQLEVFI